ncbi:flagellar hook-length control protein FliK [Photobacterium chitinilyticum]|uniref:Flagellar hook-length control protein FliK n=1 Tax=Photobacterium chitinilyticum TaxID=2485123 RepID=A0A444JTY7_9GAMM|nr:flagellar hook-length control protein FliK [Photobacterium chitinilyticum]RWX56550.1 flagellar hook-length control protein FliK [Photobacterium chitinilyticum]
MFSSRLLTADIPPSSQAKAESAKASPAMLGKESAASHEEGHFAKELQAVAGDEKKLKADQQVATEAHAKSEVSTTSAEDTESKLQLTDAASSQSAGNKGAVVNSGEQEAGNLRVNQDEIGAEVNASQTTDRQNGQISASQKLDVSAELDSASKQQIMDDGEALLNRLSESSKQLSATQAAAADMPEAGKTLPLAAQVDGEVAVDAVNTQGKAQSGAGVHQGHSPDNIVETDSMAQKKASVAGISQEELAKVFAVSGLKTVEGQATDQVSSDVSEQGEMDSDRDADVTGEGAMTALGLGVAVPAAGTEVKSVQPTPQTSADLLQSANPRTAELTKEQQASPELLDSKNKASNALTSNAAATAATFTAANSQPLLSSEAEQGTALNFGNPALMSATTGSSEAQLSGAAGAAAGVAAGALVTAMELGANESGSDGKSAELTHSLAGPTTLQGQANAQARAEAALAQSPLQLSKEQAGDELAERVQVMMSKNLKHVDIRLDPPELGKLQIKLSLNQDQASVQFTVGNQQTRDLVEQAMPRLRELLNQQGLQLAQTSVQQDSSRQQFAGQQNQQQNQTNAGQQNNSGGQPGNGDSRHQQAESGGSEPVDMYVSQPSDRVDYYA